MFSNPVFGFKFLTELLKGPGERQNSEVTGSSFSSTADYCKRVNNIIL